MAAAHDVRGQPGDQPARQPPRQSFSIATANVLHRNRHLDRTFDALAQLQADVLVLCELPRHSIPMLLSSPLGAELADEPLLAGRGWNSVTVLSRHRLQRPSRHAGSGFGAVAATIGVGDVQVAVGGVQLPPMFGFRPRARWIVGRLMTELFGPDPSLAVLAGDFNASAWQPPMRRLAGLGWSDAPLPHRAGHRRATWPAVMPMVALDHVIWRGQLAVVDGNLFDVPGSDHRGMSVTFAVG